MPGTVLGAGDSKHDKVQTLPLRKLHFLRGKSDLQTVKVVLAIGLVIEVCTIGSHQLHSGDLGRLCGKKLHLITFPFNVS